mgnify:CR=1 FL=1
MKNRLPTWVLYGLVMLFVATIGAAMGYVGAGWTTWPYWVVMVCVVGAAVVANEIAWNSAREIIRRFTNDSEATGAAPIGSVPVWPWGHGPRRGD